MKKRTNRHLEIFRKMARSKSETKRMATQRAAAEEKVGGFKVPNPELMHPSQLNGAPYNPRSITPEKLESLKADIRKFGFVENVVAQRESPKHGKNVIIGGHQRIRAIREISIEDNASLPEVPCVLMDLTDRQAKMLNVALNSERGKFVPKLLAELLEDVHHEAPITPEETAIMGLEDDDISKYLKLSEPPTVEPEESEVFARSVTLSLVFDDVRERDAVKAKLDELAEVQKQKTGKVVLDMLGARKR